MSKRGKLCFGKESKINNSFCFGMKICCPKLKTGSAKISGFLLALNSLDVVLKSDSRLKHFFIISSTVELIS